MSACRRCASTSTRSAPVSSSSPCSTTTTAAYRSTSDATTQPDRTLSAPCQHDGHPPTPPEAQRLTDRLTDYMTPHAPRDMGCTSMAGKVQLSVTRHTRRHPVDGSGMTHNPKVAGSNPAPATNEIPGQRPFLAQQEGPLALSMYHPCTTRVVRSGRRFARPDRQWTGWSV